MSKTLFNLSASNDLTAFWEVVDKCAKEKAFVKLERVPKIRSNSQNRYMYALFAILAIDLGYTVEEIKTVFKREQGYCYEKNGSKFLVSTATLNTAEMTAFIDRLRIWGSERGSIMPTAEDFGRDWKDIYKHIENHKQYI